MLLILFLLPGLISKVPATARGGGNFPSDAYGHARTDRVIFSQFLILGSTCLTWVNLIVNWVNLITIRILSFWFTETYTTDILLDIFLISD